MNERAQLEKAIAHMEAQRGLLGDAIVDASIEAMRERLATLAPAHPAEQQRRYVTVLFADISGFTALGESMDAEELGEIMNHLWDRLDQTIRAYGGTIDKHMGDAVMALWGNETARENDPEQSVRAALKIQEQLIFLNRQASTPYPLHIRIGINTGLALLGEIGSTGEYTALGDTVNLAHRLEQAAPMNGILISYDTYRHVHGVFELQPLEPLQVKGKREPVQVYLVGQAKERAFRLGTRGVEGIETRMIGRALELRHLQQAFERTIEHGQLHMVTIIGEAGMGKSRLLHELENWLEQQPTPLRYFKARASPEMQNLPYALARDLFAFRFQIQDSDPVQVVREKIEGGVAEALPGTEAQMQAHFIGQLLGFDFGNSPHLQGIIVQSGPADAQQLWDRALLYLGDYFRATAQQAVPVILLEDLHWADNSSLDLFEQLLPGISAEPLLLIGLARPTLFERRPRWGTGRPWQSQIHLEPLSSQDSQHLVREILQKVEQVPSTLPELVVSGAEGNPFYIEELIKMLIEDGVIVTNEPRWHIEPRRLTAVRVPPTLVGVLQARLDSLPLEERMILQQASVVGRTFWDSAVHCLSVSTEQDLSAEDLPQMLQALHQREMIFPRQTSLFADAQEYIFKHAILRQVTYESVLKRVRRAYHALVAEWLIEHSGARTSEYTGLIAEHLDLSGQSQEAIPYLSRAGEQAAAQFANSEAVNYFSRALELTPESDVGSQYELLLAREQVYSLQGQRETQRRDLQALTQLAKRLDSAPLPADPEEQTLAHLRRYGCQAELALRQANYAEITGDYPRAKQFNLQAIELSQQGLALYAGERGLGARFTEISAAAVRETTETIAALLNVTRLQATGHLQWGRSLWRQGQYEQAQLQLEQALQLARHTLGDPQPLRQPTEPVRSNDVCPGSPSSTAELAKLRTVEADSLRNLGNVFWYLGDYAKSQAYYEQALSIYKESSNRRGESACLNNLGALSGKQGRYMQAKRYYGQSRDRDREIGNQVGVTRSLGNLGSASMSLGEYVEARSYLEEALQICQEIDDRQGTGAALNNLGIVSAQLGEYGTAQDYFQRALEIRREIGARQGVAESLSDLGLLFHQMGDDKAAVEYGRQALRMIQELGDPFIEAYVLNRLALALAGLGRLQQAEKAYQQALVIRRSLQQLHLGLESQAGLAGLALAQGEPERAQSLIEEVLSHLEEHTLLGVDEPFGTDLTCYHVLQANGDPRAQGILQSAYQKLQAWADRIPDEPARRSFLENVPTHREIVRAWEGLETVDG
ncbi:MAG: tetratricopeptide repeat protein [Chloroflexia bacterium]|nr:tetratricopeptide repeat protein [Chloroflexia bacterium]